MKFSVVVSMILSKGAVYLCALLILLIYGCNDNKLRLGRSYAEQELKNVLSDKDKTGPTNAKEAIIKDSLMAVKVAEPILYGIYGHQNIVKQRPYEVYLINDYWVLMGTISKNREGGTFLIIINSMDGKVLEITHGK